MFEKFIYYSTKAIETSGVAIVLGGAILAIWIYLQESRQEPESAYDGFRRRLGRSILLGLEFLVAADIIATVAVKPTLENVSILGLVVLIRTFLSFSIEIELEKKLPWKKD
jgi:uncharacterized membrane protein